MKRASRGVLALLLTLPLTLFTATTASAQPAAVTPWDGAKDSSPSGADCQDYLSSVAMVPGGPEDQKVFGRLCSDGDPSGKPLEVLLHGGSYNHVYWDFPYQPEKYSYVRSATRAGKATLSVDQLGYGYSSHPPGTLITFETQAFVVHQIVQQLRQGQFGAKFRNIVLVGHSWGSLVGGLEAGHYHDVDGLVTTGLQHTVNLTAVATKVLTLLTMPSAVDPKFASRNLVDYTTSYPGVRDEAFYYQAGADPAIFPVDEATKDTLPLGQWSSMVPTLQDTATTKAVDVPVLNVDGNNDAFFCTTTCDAPGSAALEERENFTGSPCYEMLIIPETGHDVNLHRNGPSWFGAVDKWKSRCGVS